MGLRLTLKPNVPTKIGEAILTVDRRVRVHIDAPIEVPITRGDAKDKGPDDDGEERGAA